jgi:hypothetical protein
MMFIVYGDFDDSLVELYSSESYDESLRWAQRYTKNGDFGGYYSIDVVEFYPDYCGDAECNCHRARGESVWRVELELDHAG